MRGYAQESGYPREAAELVEQKEGQKIMVLTHISSPSLVIFRLVIIVWLAIPSKFEGLLFNHRFYASP